MAKGVNAKDAKTGGSLTQTRRETGAEHMHANAARNLRLHWVVISQKIEAKTLV